MILTFRPIKVWPDGWLTPKTRPPSPFSSTHRQTLGLLGRELEHLGTREAMLQVDASECDVRLDGQLRADARVGHPGVILTIETRRHGAQVYATDRYRGVGETGWQANLRAIALGLEALRRIERYGIAERGQQYAGYRELGSGIPVGAAMAIEEAARLLVKLGVEEGEEVGDPAFVIGDVELVAAYYRHAVKIHHPDVGGDADVFRRLTEARDLLLARP